MGHESPAETYDRFSGEQSLVGGRASGVRLARVRLIRQSDICPLAGIEPGS